MTDQEKLTALLTEWGVPYKSEEAVGTTIAGDKINAFVVTVGGYDADPDGSPKITGYSNFYTCFYFSRTDGSFIQMGAWE